MNITARWLLLIASTAVLASLAACSGPPRLTADTPQPQLQSTLDQTFHPGMTLAQVQAGLDQLNIPNIYRRAYPGPPPQLLARLFETGGFHLQSDQQVIHYTDLWFTFGPDQLLQRTDTDPHEQMFVRGRPINPPFHTPELLPTEPRLKGVS